MEKLKRLAKDVVSAEEAVQGFGALEKQSTEESYHVCVAFFLIMKEQRVDATPEARGKVEKAFERMKKKALKVCPPEWRALVEETQCAFVETEGKREESRSALLINAVLETLIKASTAEIEQAVEKVLGEGEEKDPRSAKATNIDTEIVEEILGDLAHVSKEEKKKYLVLVCKSLHEAHLPALIPHLEGSLGPILPLVLYVHNRELYAKLEQEFFRTLSVRTFGLIEYFPSVDIDAVLRGLQKSSAMFKPLEKILRTRPIYRERIVKEISEYIKKGSRTKCVLFIKENLAFFEEQIDSLELGCEEVLQLGEKSPHLLVKAFGMMVGLKADLREKRVQNYQKKERRLGSLVSVLTSQMGNLTEEEMQEFIVEMHKADPDLLGKVCMGLFRLKAPGVSIRLTLSDLVKGSSPGFVFVSLPYLEEEQRLKLVKSYVVDETSLLLFLRFLKPEKLFVYAHMLEHEKAERIIQLCFRKPEIFTDRIVSLGLTSMIEREPLPELLLQTVSQALALFPNMKPFVISVLKTEWKRFFVHSKAQMVSILKQLDNSATELLLSFDEDVLVQLVHASSKLQARVEEYLRKQPVYIQKKYLELVIGQQSQKDAHTDPNPNTSLNPTLNTKSATKSNINGSTNNETTNETANETVLPVQSEKEPKEKKKKKSSLGSSTSSKKQKEMPPEETH
ncbi:hypothetical protein NECID01_0602 [Nematocida sp. AWRm77]|nr:hypothetical protein NECID01_0602 [Nematocida sp. AWRm77]